MKPAQDRTHNTDCKKEARKIRSLNPEPRVTLSFYRYLQIEDPAALRPSLFQSWDRLGALGRVYIAREGINAQVSINKALSERFKQIVRHSFPGITFREAIEESAQSFAILQVKVRKKIVQDGLSDFIFKPEEAGRHLSPVEWNEALGDRDTIVVDMRNQYESAVGHFKGAILPDCDTFREELPMVRDLLTTQKDKKLLLYCTGGIRCEKASAYLKKSGFKDVNQLQGGIINYAREVKEKGLKCHFEGKNFVFDDRLGERITNEVLTKCATCGTANDDHTNCANDICHVLFIQCPKCRNAYENCCSTECQEFRKLPKHEQRAQAPEFRKGFRSRLRPKIRRQD